MTERSIADQMATLAKEATNGWACYAKRDVEHAEIARLHTEIARLEKLAKMGPRRDPAPVDSRDTYCDEQYQPAHLRCFDIWPTDRNSWCIGCKNLKSAFPVPPERPA